MDVANPDFLIRAADFSLIVYLVLLAIVGLWAIQGRLTTAMKAKYPRRVAYMSQIPFAYRWRQSVSAEDLPVFERARVRQLVFLVCISLGSLLIATFGYVHAVAWLWKCNMQAAGLLHGQ
jgi:hypothetical protein